MSYKLVIKGQSENAEFPAVDSAEFPRMTLYDGTYIPLVEDDGSDGTTLKVRIDDKVYRIKKGNQWEVYFAVEFSSGGQYRAFVAVVDDSYKLKIFDATSGRAVFESTYLKKTSSSDRNIYSVLHEYVHGPFYAEFGTSLVSVAERRPDTNLGDAGNRYTQMCVASSLSVQALPFAEVAFSWIIAAQGSAQGCIYNPNTRQNYYWAPYEQYVCVADHLYLFFNASAPYYTGLKNAALFTGKIRLIKLNQDGTSSIIDLNPRLPIDRTFDTNFMAFAIPDKNVDVPFETFISDQRNNVQFMLDLYGGIYHTTSVAANTGHVEGKYLDITTVFYSPFTNSVTVKKSATVIAMNYTGPNYTPYVVKANYSAGDTFTFDGYTTYTNNYPVAMLAFTNASNLPTEIVFLNSVRDVFGYIYNTQSEACSMQTGTYLRLNGYNVELYTPFDGDLLVQPLMGAVSIVDGRSSWSFTQFCGFLMVFLASNSTIIVNTTVGDDVMIFDKNGILLDEQTAGNSGNVTFTVPTTKLGRQYHIQSVTTGASADIVASGNMSVRMVMPEGAVQIYKDGQFSNVIDGFNISNYKLVLDGSSEYTYANAIPYLNTSWGINNKASNNSGDFTIDGNYIIKSQQSTSSVPGTYYIPIKRVSGYNKLRCSVKMRNTGSSNAIEIGAYLSKPSDTSFPFEIVGRYQNSSYTDQNDVELCALLDSTKDVDYIRLMGDVGTPAYNNIRLIKDSVRKSETPINVIFRDGQWGPGVTTDFDFTGKTFSMTSGTDINSYAKPLMFSRYLLRLNGEHQTNAYVINGNSIYHGDDGLWGDNYNLSNIYIPIKRAYGYTKCKVKMGQLSMGTGGQWKNYVACVASYIDSNRVMNTIRDLTIFNTMSVNEYEIDISNVGYCDYIVLGCTEGDCVWQSITLE